MQLLLLRSRGVHRQQPFPRARQMNLTWPAHYQAVRQQELQQGAILDGMWSVYEAFEEGEGFRGEFFHGHLDRGS
jgi:hypothetical protein